jgi:hypothetical protein
MTDPAAPQTEHYAAAAGVPTFAPSIPTSDDPVETDEVGVRRPHLRLVWMCRIIAVFLGVVQAWAFRFEANPDGVSYLDVADAYREGRWGDAPNGYWSPLYSWLLAGAAAVVRLPPSFDFVVVHVVNVVAFLAALIAFEYFLRGTVQLIGESSESAEDSQRDWWILGYSLFVWAMLALIGLGVTTPDLLLAAAAFTSAGLLVRIRLTGARRKDAAALGVVAGLGYLCKAAFLPLALVFLVVAGVLWWRSGRAVPLLMLAILCLAIVALPYAVALSRAKGRITFGESGRVAYAWIVNGVPGQVHWQGGPPGAGTPVHPTRQISITPDAYEFASPLVGTYPPWYDPSYWYDGVAVRAAPVTQARIAYGYLPLLFELHLPLLVVMVAIVLALRIGLRSLKREVGRGWWLIVPGVGAMAMYAGLFLETRYIAAFVVMVWFGCLLILDGFVPSNWRRGLFAAAAAVLLLRTLPSLTPKLSALLPGARNTHWEDARFVLNAGLERGDTVAVVGDGFFAYWARLARARIVAEVPSRSATDFWHAAPTQQSELLESFRRAGAKAVVARVFPLQREALVGWQVSPDRRLAVRLLPAQAAQEGPLTPTGRTQSVPPTPP